MHSIIFRCFLALFITCTHWLLGHSIIFIHIGPTLPSHIPFTLSQARLFNKQCPIYLIANEYVLSLASPALQAHNITPVSCESLAPSPAHQKLRDTGVDYSIVDNLWVYSSERFFYLDEFVRTNDLHDVFHLENDILLYTDLTHLLPVFHKHYQGMIGATFENGNRCVPGFMYISNSYPLARLIEYFPSTFSDSWTDMDIIGLFKKKHHHTFIDDLPLVCREYATDHPEGFAQYATDPASYSNRIEEFGSIFDAAAFGIFIGAWNQYFHPESNPGDISPWCVFNASHFDITWKLDNEERRIPFISYKGVELPINNLHLTNKRLLPHYHSTEYKKFL